MTLGGTLSPSHAAIPGLQMHIRQGAHAALGPQLDLLHHDAPGASMSRDICSIPQ
jgi:hypothetical protein